VAGLAVCHLLAVLLRRLIHPHRQYGSNRSSANKRAALVLDGARIIVCAAAGALLITVVR
jgi:hypothetical protein